MASQSKRGHLMRSATYRSRTDISADWAEGGDSKPETSLRGLTGPNDQATGSSHTVCDRVSLALASERQPGEGLPPELAPSARGDAEMGGGDFRHARLGHADLAAANLSHVSFNHADLAGANLTEAKLNGANLRFATASVAGLSAADLSRADLRLACFNRANLSAANLRGALLDHADFSGANLANANLCGASLRFATLAAAELGAANLSGADLRHARLNQTDLAAANLSGAFLDYADFSGANLANTNLSGAQLRYAKNLTRTQFEEARISDSTILPFHFREPAPQILTGRKARTGGWGRRVAGLALIGLIGALAPIGLAWQPQVPSGQAASLVVWTPPAKPILASLTPAVFSPDLLVEATDASRHTTTPLPAAASLYPRNITPKLTAVVSALMPVASEPVAADALRIGDVTDVLTPPPASVLVIAAVADIPSARHALNTPGPIALKTPGAIDVLSDASPPLVAAVPMTLRVRVKEKATETPAIAAPVEGEPLTLVVSLNQQKIDVYRGTALVTSAKVSSGKRGYDTRAGVFSILEKHRRHHSNLFSGAPMPWMQRMTWSGTALHGGIVPGYPASHGCVRLPFSFAPKLFQMTNVGENVVVAHDRVAPKLIEHPNLFQPASAHPQMSMVLVDQEALVAPSDWATRQATPQSPEQEAVDASAGAEDASTAPLRILITRRTERDRIIGVQYLLASLGYLKPQNFTGRVGPETIAAIKAFQKVNGLKETGAFTDDLAKTVHLVAGKAEPPAGHLFVRQDFRRVFDMPVAFRHPEKELGTHVFTATKSPPGNAKTPWMAISLEGDDPVNALDRIEIPDEARQEISARLSPGSSLIIADTSVNSAVLREGDDFIVWTNDKVAAFDARQIDAKQAKVKKTRSKQAKAARVGKPRVQGSNRSARRRFNSRGLYGGFWSFRRW